MCIYTHIHIYVTTGEEWAMNLKENQGKQVPWEGLEGGNGGGKWQIHNYNLKKKIKYLRRGGRAEWWRLTPLILPCWMQSPARSKFQNSLVYREKPCYKKPKKMMREGEERRNFRNWSQNKALNSVYFLSKSPVS